MKYIIGFCVVFISLNCLGQDYCKDISKSMSANKKIIELESPYDPEYFVPLRAKRTINKDEYDGFDNFNIVFQVTCNFDAIDDIALDGGRTEKNETKLHIEFYDNSKIIDDTVKISHDFTVDRTEAIRYVYYSLNEATRAAFSTKKIKKFTIAGQERLIPEDSATVIMEYVKCMNKDF